MNRFEAARRMAGSAAIRSLDFSMFSTRDIANTALQRSEVLRDVPGGADALRAWTRGRNGPILDIAEREGLELVRRAVAFVFLEYRGLRPVLRDIAPRRIADIGCGSGFFALFAQADFGAELLLIDTETSEDRVLRYSETGPGCANLATARDFLAANGADRTGITAVNPDRDDVLEHGSVDLAVSFLTCGFLFPVSAYEPFFKSCVRPGGSVILDLRTRRAQENLASVKDLGTAAGLTDAADGKAMRMHLVTRAEAARNAA